MGSGMDSFLIIKTAIEILIIPALAFFIKKYVTRIEIVEDKIKSIEVRTAVVESKIDDIREDLKEIKHGVNRLIDRRADERNKNDRRD